MNSLEEVSLKNKVLKFKALGGCDILNRPSVVISLQEHYAMHLSLWSSIPHRSLGLVNPALSWSTVTVDDV